jgi:hypothetical protein
MLSVRTYLSLIRDETTFLLTGFWMVWIYFFLRILEIQSMDHNHFLPHSFCYSLIILSFVLNNLNNLLKVEMQ